MLENTEIAIYRPMDDPPKPTADKLSLWEDSGERLDNFLVVVCDERNIKTRSRSLKKPRFCVIAQTAWELHSTMGGGEYDLRNCLIIASEDRKNAMTTLDELRSRGAVPLMDLRADGAFGDESFKYVRGEHIDLERSQQIGMGTSIKWLKDWNLELRTRVAEAAMWHMSLDVYRSISRALFHNWPSPLKWGEERKRRMKVFPDNPLDRRLEFIKAMSFGYVDDEYRNRIQAADDISREVLFYAPNSIYQEIRESEFADFELAMLAVKNCWVDALIRYSDVFSKIELFTDQDMDVHSPRSVSQLVEKGTEVGVDIAISSIVDGGVPISFEVDNPIGWSGLYDPPYLF